MKKIYSFIAITLTVFMLIFTPTQKVEAGTCDAVCLLQMGNSSVQNLGTQLKSILATIQQTIMGWLEEAKAWLDKYAQKAFSGIGKDVSQVKVPETKVPSLTDKSTGISPGKSYDIKGANDSLIPGLSAPDQQYEALSSGTVNATTAANTPTNKIDKIAEAKQNELLSIAGTLQGSQYEMDKKRYIDQQQSIDTLAQALVAKNTLTELEQLGEELDRLYALLQGVSSTKPEQFDTKKITDGTLNTSTIGSGVIDLVTSPINTAIGGTSPQKQADKTIDTVRNRDLHTAQKDNLRVRLILDKLLVLKQQVLALRVKNAANLGIRQMEQVSDIEVIEIIVPEALPSPQDKVKSPAQ